MKKILIFPIITLISLISIIGVFAELNLDHIQFDPAIIASGDQVDVVVQFHYTETGLRNEMIGNPDYDFKTTLEPYDTLTKDYILIQDSEGNDVKTLIYSNQYYSKKFRLKIQDNAPAGNYALKLVGQWYKNGQPYSSQQSANFMMQVKKEGISLSVSNIISDPERIRSGDKNILLNAEIYNSGEKAAKNVKVGLFYPQGITSSYTNNNQLNLGVIESMQKKTLQFYVDTDKYMKSGIYYVNYTLDYQDTDSNNYYTVSSFPVVIKKKPHIVVINSSGFGLAGKNAELKVVLKNIGEEKADAVDVRIIKQSSQPFEMDVRSSYIGQLNPGEEATAIFNLGINQDAEIKIHNLNLAIRAKGDSEEGDSNVYTYSDSASLDVTGKVENNYPTYAAIFAGLVVVFAVIFYAVKKSK